MASSKLSTSDDDWLLTARTTGDVVKRIKARDLWEQIAVAAWQCADPGLQFDDTIQEWHTCSNDDRINATNPCVTGDSLIATADGPKRIADLVGKAAFVIGADAKPHLVTNIFPTGTKPVYRLRTRAGYELDLTADHKVWTENRGDIAACELQQGDRIALGGSGFGQVSLDERIALGIGTAVGDGCISRTATPYLILTMHDRRISSPCRRRARNQSRKVAIPRRRPEPQGYHGHSAAQGNRFSPFCWKQAHRRSICSLCRPRQRQRRQAILRCHL